MDMISLELENRIARIEAELAALKNRDAPRRVIPAPPEPVTRISTPVPVIATDMPDGKELQRLLDICAAAYPDWCSAEGFCSGRRGGASEQENKFEYLMQFSSAIRAISHMRVLDKPDHKRYVSAHCDDAHAMLRRIGKSVPELRAAPLVMSCFAMQVPVSGLGISGGSISLGLSEYSGRPVDPSIWRETLSAGRMPQQHPVEGRPPQSDRVEVISMRQSS